MLRKERVADPYRDLDVIDSRAPRFNQATIGLLAALGVAAGWWWMGPLEDSRPPRFANMVGAAFLTVAAVAWTAGLATVGAAFGALVAALALLAAVTGFCAGCEAYKLGSLFLGRPYPLPPQPVRNR